MKSDEYDFIKFSLNRALFWANHRNHDVWCNSSGIATNNTCGCSCGKDEIIGAINQALENLQQVAYKDSAMPWRNPPQLKNPPKI